MKESPRIVAVDIPIGLLDRAQPRRPRLRSRGEAQGGASPARASSRRPFAARSRRIRGTRPTRSTAPARPRECRAGPSDVGTRPQDRRGGQAAEAVRPADGARVLPGALLRGDDRQADAGLEAHRQRDAGPCRGAHPRGIRGPAQASRHLDGLRGVPPRRPGRACVLLDGRAHLRGDRGPPARPGRTCRGTSADWRCRSGTDGRRDIATGIPVRR